MFNINTSSDKAIYEQIIDNIKELVFRKDLKADDRLPSVRDMASMLSVNPNTVSKAYQELERQKITHTVRGRGTFISSNKDSPIDQDRVDDAIKNLKNICVELGHLGFSEEMIVEEIKKFFLNIDKEV